MGRPAVADALQYIERARVGTPSADSVFPVPPNGRRCSNLNGSASRWLRVNSVSLAGRAQRHRHLPKSACCSSPPARAPCSPGDVTQVKEQAIDRGRSTGGKMKLQDISMARHHWPATSDAGSRRSVRLAAPRFGESMRANLVGT
jgi:hypothetical protein